MKTLGILTLVLFASLAVAENAGGPSQEEFIRKVVASIAAKDETALKQLTISKDEFKKYVWPNVAARVSGAGMTADKFYGMYEQSSGAGLKQGIAQLGGQKMEVVKISPGAVQKQGKDYTLFLAPDVLVRGSDGTERSLRPVGGLLEQHGSLKVTTYFTSPGNGAAAPGAQKEASNLQSRP